MHFIFTLLIFMRLLAQYSRKLLLGKTGAQAIGFPANSRRALLSCCWSAARYMGQHCPWLGILRGDKPLQEMGAHMEVWR